MRISFQTRLRYKQDHAPTSLLYDSGSRAWFGIVYRPWSSAIGVPFLLRFSYFSATLLRGDEVKIPFWTALGYIGSAHLRKLFEINHLLSPIQKLTIENVSFSVCFCFPLSHIFWVSVVQKSINEDWIEYCEENMNICKWDARSGDSASHASNCG